MGACSVWDIDLDCCDLPDNVEQATIDTWQAVATDILWYASGQRYGVCEVTVRPCLRRCGGGSGFPFTPYKGADGAWRNIGCGCIDDCSCVALSEIVLPGPVASIVSVFDGAEELEEGINFRLDTVGGQWRLVRVDGGAWPECSDMTAECGTAGAFCVTYEQGIEVDALGTQAVTQLACQLIRACIPGCKCDLPKNVQSVVRRGVAITFDNSSSWIRSLPLVDQWLTAVNPNGLMSASSAWSPDVGHARITPEPSVS